LWRPALFVVFRSYDAALAVLYPLSLHDALPICGPPAGARHRSDRLADCRGSLHLPGQPRMGDPGRRRPRVLLANLEPVADRDTEDRKSTRLNSSHVEISYAVFCLKKKKETNDDE